jgi:hypothetical protein
VKVLGTFLAGESHEVTTCITLGVLGVDASDRVEWLVDVTDIVDEEA